MEKQLNREIIYEGKVVRLYKDQVQLSQGSIEYREIVEHHGGVCIALKDDEGVYFLVKQYRYAFNDYLYEFPAGKLEVGEEIETAILREAKEETGCTVKNLKYHHYFIPTCGYSNEKIYLFSGEVATQSNQELELGEDLELFRFTLEEILEMIKKNQIIDGKTIILAYKLQLEKSSQ